MAPTRLKAFIGTYSVRGSVGIYAVSLDTETGSLSEPVSAVADPAARVLSPTFLALDPAGRHLFASSEGRGWVSSLGVVPGAAPGTSGSLVPLRPPEPSTCKPPCHVCVDRTGRTVLATHYHAGLVAALPILADGAVGAPQVVEHTGGRGPHPERQAAAHPHSVNVTPDNRFAVVCDLGLDRITAYPLDPARATLDVAGAVHTAARPGCGPRHLAWSADGARAHVVNELDNTVDTYALDAAAGSLTLLQTVSILPAGFAGASTAAEIRVRPDGRFAYASNRGHDSIAVLAVGADGLLSLVGTVPCGGRAPRHFGVSPDGRWLLCAHQESDTLCSFAIDPAAGGLTRVPGTVRAPAAVCVLFGP